MDNITVFILERWRNVRLYQTLGYNWKTSHILANFIRFVKNAILNNSDLASALYILHLWLGHWFVIATLQASGNN